MVLTKAEMFPEAILPETQDRMVAARTSSLFCWIAAMWFFLSPWAYFGVSEQSSAWNAWIVGGVMVACCFVRLAEPRGTAAFSMVNAVLSLWVLASPFIFGYSGDIGRLVNSLGVGVVALGFSLLSFLITKDVKQRIATSDA